MSPSECLHGALVVNVQQVKIKPSSVYRATQNAPEKVIKKNKIICFVEFLATITASMFEA